MASSLLDIQTRVLDTLKRKDVTQTQLQRWITDSIRRIQRTLRTPMDEAVTTAIVPEGFDGAISIPGNLVELISLRCDGRELEMRSPSEVNQWQRAGYQGHAQYYCRHGGEWQIAPVPPAGSKVEVYYRADWANVTQPTDNLKLFDVAADLVTVGALLQAADWSVDPKRMSMWNSEYNSLFLELQDLYDRTVLLNAVISPCYNFDGL